MVDSTATLVLPIPCGLKTDTNSVDVTATEATPVSVEQAKRAIESLMIEGYQAMADENIRLAEEFLPSERSDWPKWEG